MRFEKWQGIGNDFVMLADPDNRIDLSSEQIARMCDRRFGIGADGVIRVTRGENGAELFMDYVNSDGSIGEMCGNGIRCLALFAREQGLTTDDEIKVGTRAGTKVVTIEGQLVRVDMGAPIFDPRAIPARFPGPDALHVQLDTSAGTIDAAVLSMGNPHAVIFVDDPAAAPIATLGPEIEWLDAFPRGANIEWAAVESPARVRMTVWERGSGQTMACGTGACAVGVAARLLHKADETMTIVLPGGECEVSWSGSLEAERPVFLTGPAVKTFAGEIDVEDLS